MVKDKFIMKLLEMLNGAVLRHKADSILLSGGLDTSALALIASRAYKMEAMTVAFKDRPGPDVKYSQLIAGFLKIKRHLRMFDLDEALYAINDVISILRTFDPAEIRNGITIFFGLKHAKKLGFNSVMTGDGGTSCSPGMIIC
jgi:asparagine synthase (glutamine-hydrolysing)